MKMFSFLLVWASTLGVLFPPQPLAAAQEDVRITEFMASNTRTLQDDDHAYPDWIEIFNAGSQPVNLLDWSLTDSAGNLTKWRFPATNIPPIGFLVVFADGKNHSVAGAPLHTSFSLSAGGEYLALVRPDGTIATEFKQINGGYPGQAPDVSYGAASISTNISVVTTNSPVRWRIPDGTEPTSWAATNYDDSAWAVGTNGVGFGNFLSANYSQAVLPTLPLLYYRMNESSGTTAANLGSATASDGTYNSVTLGTAGPRPSSGFNGFEGNNNAPTFNGTSSYVAGPSQVLSGRSAFTIGGWVNFSAAPIARTGLFGQNDVVEFGFSAAGNLQCFTGNSGGTPNATYNPPLNTWVHLLAVGDGASVRIFINGAQAASASASVGNYGTSAFGFNIGGGGVFDATGNFLTGQIDEVVVYSRALSTTEILGLYQAGTNGTGSSSSSLIRTDVAAAMSNVNASAYIRIPFVVTNVDNVSLVSLRMQYNDGFVASINGDEVVRVNAPDPLAWNSTATAGHASANVEEFRFGTGTLVTGTNVLAIQGLNLAANDTNFLISAELVLTTVEAESPTPLYFTVPTPGAPNVGGIGNPGPAILNASNYPAVPLDAQNMTVSARIAPTFYAVSNVVMRYQIMFGSTNEVQMLDDGLHGDGAAGDGVFGATIPESASTNGQMIRWYFLATDVQGNTSRWPLFANPAASEQYLGTIVNPTNVTSKLPIYHIFAPPSVVNPGPVTEPKALADSQTGGFVSIFYDGEFYDNVAMNLRGNSTANFNKKAHHLNFNPEHPFRHTGPGGRIRHTSFTAEYPDPSYMRQFLSFWLAGQMGAPEPFYYPVRLQLNGQFYQLASHNDPPGAEQLSRFGMDPLGALYKAYGTIVNPIDSTGQPEKKTRLTEGNSDYVALAAGLVESNSPGARRTNVFDLLDVPEVLDYLVTARWVHENDDIWANMTVYRDTMGDGLWRIIPFDMNLSWGAIFYEGGAACMPYVEGVQATNDAHKAHPLYGSSQTLACSAAASRFNRMYDTFFQVPEFRQMFLRRMRTLMDTWIKPIGTPTNSTALEQMILARRDLIAEEAITDRAKWGWPPKAGQCNFDPGIDLTNGVNQLITQFIYARRGHFYGKHSVTNTALAIGIASANNAGIPLAQPPNAVINIAGIEANPASGNQAEEYLCLTNPTPFALDISGWKLSGAIDFTFKPGTVMTSNSVIYVSPNVVAFRARTTGPRRGQGLFVVGPYSGQLSARGESIRITDNVGRLVGTNSYPGSPSLAQQFLRITEIMYHPAPWLPDTNLTEELEFMELKNTSPDLTLSLAGIRFTNGIDFTFTPTNAVTSLAPGQTVLIVKNPGMFAARYGNGFTNIAGQYGGYLDNNGERIQLVDAGGEEILDFSYNNSWYPITDGLGFSLVVVDELAQPDAWGSKTNWRPSGQAGGTPGGVDPGAPVIVPVVINEALTRTDFPPPTDSIELFNPTGSSADLSGWFLSDDFINPKKYRIPNGTILAPGSYLVFDESQFNPHPGVAPSFALSGEGDEVFLFSAKTNGDLTGYFHGFDFGAGENGVSFGRHVTSDGKEHFVAQAALSLGTNNAGPRVGPVVINELMYHPPENGINDNTDDEFIEVLNISSNAVLLFDNVGSFSPWKLAGGIGWNFGTNTSLAVGESLLVVNFDPTNAPMLNAFRAKYGVGPATQVYGPYSGKLGNNGDDVQLLRPGEFLNGHYPYVLVDRVEYSDSAPWPEGADGFGLSLQRKNAAAFGDEPTNWVAALPTAAAPTPASATAPAVTSQPGNQTVLGSASLSLGVTATGDSPLRYQWRFNGANIAGATNSILQFSSVQPQNAGDYKVLVLNNAGSAVSSNFTLTVVLGASIQTHPQGLTLFPSNSAAFSVQAYSPSPLSYQWRFNGTNIANATNNTLSIPSVQPSQDGDYTVAVTDAVGSVVSDTAHLNVLLHPVFTLQPVSRIASVITNGINISFTNAATSTTPIRYQWRFNGTNILGATNTILNLTNVQTPAAGDYSVVATDNYGSITSTNATLSVLYIPIFTQQPNSQIIPYGGTATFTSSLSGSLPITFRWRRTSVVIYENTTNSNTGIYITNNVTSNGVYTANITNLAGTSFGGPVRGLSSNAYLFVVIPPSNQVVSPGGDATFSAALAGLGRIDYQWQFNGTNLAGATNSSLTLTSVLASAQGDYSVIATAVTNAFVPPATFTAHLQVAVPAPTLSSPQTKPDGSFQALLLGQSNQNYIVEISTNLTNWATLTPITTTNASMPIVDSTATNAPQRFYRVRAGP